MVRRERERSCSIRLFESAVEHPDSAGTAGGVARVGEFAENADDGVWAATVDPLAGVLSGTAGDETGGATFELTFSPFSPPVPG